MSPYALRQAAQLRAEWRAKAGAVQESATAKAEAEQEWRSLQRNTPKPKAPVCVGKMFRGHPDKKLRDLAEAQAHEVHQLNDYIAHGEIHVGKCPGKACRPLRDRTPISMFAKNDHTHRIAVGLKRQARINERGW